MTFIPDRHLLTRLSLASLYVELLETSNDMWCE